MKKHFALGAVVTIIFVATACSIDTAEVNSIVPAYETSYVEIQDAVVKSEEKNEDWGVLYPFAEGILRGYKDMYGNVVIKPQFIYAGRFSEGLAFVWGETSEQTGFIDLEGNLVIPAPLHFGSQRLSEFSNGLAPVVKREWNYDIGETCPFPIDPFFPPSPGLTVFIDRTGQVVFDKEFYSASRFSEGLAFVGRMDDNHGQTWAIDLAGNFIFSINILEFGLDGMFTEGFVSVIVREWDWYNEPVFTSRTGPLIFIDQTGKMFLVKNLQW